MVLVAGTRESIDNLLAYLKSDTRIVVDIVISSRNALLSFKSKA